MSNAEHPNVEPWQLGFQEPVTPVMEQLDSLHDGLTIVAVAITLFVLALLFIVMVKFRESKNPKPSTVTHNTKLEIAWTVIPVIILIAISIPSVRTLYYMDKAPNPDMVLKVVGYQWYWNYEYPDTEGLSFDSYMIKDEDLKPGDVRLLSVDNPVVVPVDTTVAVHITGGDVIHAWAMPAFGVKTDALPGRLNETWFKATKEGVYFGQCSELCGVGHGFMPIELHVVSKPAYKAWASASKAALDGGVTFNSRAVLTQVKQDPAVIEAETKIKAALDIAMEKAAEAGEAVVDAAGDAVDAVESAEGTVKEAASAAEGKVKEAVDSAKEAVKDVEAKASDFNKKANAKIEADNIVNEKAGE